jgi:hypothetical protein
MPATRTAAGAAPRLYFCERGGLPVEVACVADAVRLAGYWSDHGGRERAGRDGTAGVAGWYLVAAHTAPEADRQAEELFVRLHPDQHAIDFEHALIRNGAV